MPAVSLSVVAFLLSCAPPPGPTRVLVILDTVRADHTSLCGYERATTPTLDALKRRGASATCRAYAPSGWTLPSHATMFTGVPAIEHGADYTDDPSVPLRRGSSVDRVRGLGPTPATLAERAVGAETVLVSANPVVRHYGLTRGFESVVPGPEGPSDRMLSMEETVQLLSARLLTADRRRPLLLVVNLSDAHHPWVPVPSDSPVAPRRPLLSRFWSPESLTPESLRHRTDLYDHGVWRADQGLARVMDALGAAGRTRNGLRLVVTSDHGELLGEGGLLDHGRTLYEAEARVPLLVWDDTAPPPALHEPISIAVIPELLLDGRLPEPLPAVEAVQAMRHDPLPGTDIVVPRSAAIWTGATKAFASGAKRWSIDLAVDPDEAAPRVTWERSPRLETLMTPSTGGAEVTDTEMLRALGYLGP